MPSASAGRGGAPKKKSSTGRMSPGSTSFGGKSAGGKSAAGKKERWSSEKRQSHGLSAERPRGSRPVSAERPNWEPRRREDADAAIRDAEASSRFRTGRPAHGRDDRPARSWQDRPARDERPARFSRDDRPSRDRDERPARDDRPARGDRFSRDERPARFSRDERPAREHRPARDERPARFSRDERPARDDRPARGDRFSRTDRPVRDRDDRAARDERPARFSRDERPARDDRPARDERPARGRFDRADSGRPVTGASRRPGSSEFRERRPSTRGAYEGDRRDHDRRDHPHSDRGHSDRGTEPRHEPVEDVVLERLEAEAMQASDVEGTTFADLGLGANIVRELTEQGATTPFAIQAATIPDALAGRDVLGRGRTGSGKTIAFAAPLVERLLQSRADRTAGERRKPGRAPEALILAPTRELALQIDRTVQPIARSVGLFTTQVYGGVPYAKQYGALSRGVDIVIGTPGRVEDLIEQGRLDLSQVSIVVLDEADHMTDLGFLEPVQRILRRTADDGQRMLFSATLDTAVAALVDEFLSDPAVHEVAGEQASSSTIEHLVFALEQRDKLEVLAELAHGPSPKLVFVRTRAFAEDVADMLDDRGIDAVALHGDLTQPRRTRNLERFSRGRATVLVATDVAARGIHIDDVALVIQADAPDEYKTYLHRSGRTGRAGKDGVVVTLVAKNRRRRVEELLGRAGIQPEWTTVRPDDDTVRDLVDRVNAAPEN